MIGASPTGVISMNRMSLSVVFLLGALLAAGFVALAEQMARGGV